MRIARKSFSSGLIMVPMAFILTSCGSARVADQVASSRSVAQAAPYVLKHRGFLGPEEIRENSVSSLGEAIVNRLHTQCDLTRSHTADSAGIDSQSQIIMMIHSQALNAVQRYGIPNQHVSQATSGSDAPKLRFAAEQELILLRLPYSSAGRELLPHYGVFNVRRNDFGTFNLPSEYGDVALVFKDEVKARTTWTYSDSLEIPETTYTRTADRFPARTTRYEKTASDTMYCSGYCESQIWGDLNLSDVDHILLEDGAAVPDAIKNLGIPIFYWEPDATANQAIPFSEKSVLPGSKKAIPLPASLSAGDIESRLEDPKTSWPAQRILESRKYAMLSDSDIIGKLSDQVIMSEVPRLSTFDFGDRYIAYGAGFIVKEFLAAELATRIKTTDVMKKLIDLLTDTDGYVRQFAYYGLTELPYQQFKPLLLKCLSDSSRWVQINCIGYAGDFVDTDQDIAAAVKAVGAANSRDAAIPDWSSRIVRKTMCN